MLGHWCSRKYIVLIAVHAVSVLVTMLSARVTVRSRHDPVSSV